MNAKTAPFRVFVLALAGPIVWAAHFFIVYGLEATVCARAPSPVLMMRWIVAIATAAAVASLAAFLIQRFRKRPSESAAFGFLHEISVWLALIAVCAVLAVAASTVRLSACMQPAG